MSPALKKNFLPRAFTLVELLVSMTILGILLMIVASILGNVQKAWRQAATKVSQFREARRAFDRITFAVGQATINPYFVYRYPNSTDPYVPPAKSLKDTPTGYMRFSELQFVCGPASSAGNPKLIGLNATTYPGHAMFFQAPLGSSSNYRVPTGLNGCGFFVQFGDDSLTRPPFLQGRLPLMNAYRLYEYRSTVETNSIYDEATRTDQSDWYSDFATKSLPIANNIVLLLVSPKRPIYDNETAAPTDIAPNYSYDSSPGTLGATQNKTDYQLPPLVEITLVAIDQASADILSESGAAPPLSTELGGKFTIALDYATDLAALEQQLVTKKVNYRVFNATIPIRASKWGTQ